MIFAIFKRHNFKKSLTMNAKLIVAMAAVSFVVDSVRGGVTCGGKSEDEMHQAEEEPQMILSDPKFGATDSYATSHFYCRYNIQGKPGYAVELEFKEFRVPYDIDFPGMCEDNLKLFRGSVDGPIYQLHTLCGSGLPSRKVIGDEMIVAVLTHGHEAKGQSQGHKGFALQYRLVPEQDSYVKGDGQDNTLNSYLELITMDEYENYY